MFENREKTRQISNEKIDISRLLGEPFEYRLVSFPVTGQEGPTPLPPRPISRMIR